MKRSASAAAVKALFELLKAGELHAGTAHAQLRDALDACAEACAALTSADDSFVCLWFVSGELFVNGVRRDVDGETESHVRRVESYLASANFNELTIRRGVVREHLSEFVDSVLRHGSTERLPGTMRLRWLDPSRAATDPTERSRLRLATLYGELVVGLSELHAGARRDDLRWLRVVKRSAQDLVDLSERCQLELLLLARQRVALNDEARLSLHSGLLALLATRTFTQDRAALLRVLYGTICASIGVPRVAGLYREDAFDTDLVPRPNEAMRRRLPSSSALMLFENVGRSSGPLGRVAAAYEVAWLSDVELLGWPYDNRLAPTVEGVLSASASKVVRTMNEVGGVAELTSALQTKLHGKIEQAATALLLGVLGHFSRGTPIELTTGYRGMVLRPGEDLHSLERPTVVLLMDPHGKRCPPRETVVGGAEGYIARVVGEPDQFLATAMDEWSAANGADSVDGFTPAGFSNTVTPATSDTLEDFGTLDFEGEEDNPDTSAFDPKDLPFDLEQG